MTQMLAHGTFTADSGAACIAIEPGNFMLVKVTETRRTIGYRLDGRGHVLARRWNNKGEVDDVVVLGEAHTLVGPHAVIAQVLITVLALGAGTAAVVTVGAEGRNATLVDVAVLILIVVGYHYVQDVVKEV